MSAVLQFTTQLESTTCPECGVQFAGPAHLLKSKREHAGSIYCPNGHVSSWRETEADRLRRELEQAKKDKEWAEKQRDQAREARDAAERKASALRGVVTKTKQRVGNGVCPCCNRTFKALSRHMATKHPEFKDAAQEGEANG